MTAWMTRIVPDTRTRATRHDLHDVVAMHRRLMSLLPDELGAQARAQAGLLFRIDYPGAGTPVVLAQSSIALEVGRLPNGYGSTGQRRLDPMLDALTEGLLVRFRLAANASKRLFKADEHHDAGKIVALGGEAAEHWWRSRAETRHGLHLLDLRSESLPAAQGRRGTQTVTHSITRFDGTARVHDPDAVRRAVLDGIGRGKAYGCGLLSLSPTPA